MLHHHTCIDTLFIDVLSNVSALNHASVVVSSNSSSRQHPLLGLHRSVLPEQWQEPHSVSACVNSSSRQHPLLGLHRSVLPEQWQEPHSVVSSAKIVASPSGMTVDSTGSIDAAMAKTKVSTTVREIEAKTCAQNTSRSARQRNAPCDEFSYLS